MSCQSGRCNARRAAGWGREEGRECEGEGGTLASRSRSTVVVAAAAAGDECASIVVARSSVVQASMFIIVDLTAEFCRVGWCGESSAAD